MIHNKTVAVTPTIDTDAYTANDVVGGLMTFAFGGVGGSGSIRSITIADDDDEKAAFTLYIFNAAPSTIADDAAFAPTIADLKKLVTTVLVEAGDYATVNSNAYAILGGHEDLATKNMDIPYASADGNLYMYAVCTATPTYTAATDLTFTITARIDD